MHGPAILSDFNSFIFETQHSLSSASIDLAMSQTSPNAAIDFVMAVHSPYWPVEASEWITRTRGFPKKNVIRQIVRYGCDFVQVLHNRLSNDNEWRFSFSQAELLLTKSFTISQRIVYSTLWVLNKKIASRNLCTYYFKTLMFWGCEEKPTEFWGDDMLVYSVRELLIEMMNWLKSKLCVNNFIPGNNMIDHLIATDLSYEIDTLWKAFQSLQLISKIADTSFQCELVLAHRKYHIELPAWIKRANVINWRVDNEVDNYTDLFCTDLTTDLMKSVYVELADIYRGLCCQQKSVSCASESDKHIYFIQSERHMLLAVNLCESHERDVVDNYSIEFIRTMIGYFIPCGNEIEFNNHIDAKNSRRRSTHHKQNSVIGRNEQKCLLYSCSVQNTKYKLDDNFNSKRDEDKSVNIAFISEIGMIKYIEFYKKWPGQSTTVNISWFIAKAYLANLYYTTQRDDSIAIQICDDVINVYRQFFMNEWFVKKTFRVVLSTQWTSIYDKEIQELLGFHSLCSYVLDESSSRSVYLEVCTVQFALYVKMRTAKRAHLFSVNTANEYIDDYNEHMPACFGNTRSTMVAKY